MDVKERLAQEIRGVPEPLLLEVVDFVRFLKHQAVAEKLETVWLSEATLGKEWLRPEEDEAWRDL